MGVLPYKEDQAGKKQQVARMFDNISRRYDLLNHLLSLGIDKGWRKKAIRMLRPLKPAVLLDVATGTGDFAIQALELKPERVIGVDISAGMLEMGRQKIARLGVSHLIELQLGDSENLRFEENKFDAVTVAFGVRNFENLEKGLKEILRVMKPGAMLVVLEFSRPVGFPFRQIYNFYFKIILPKIGRMISKDKSAYTYLPASVEAFPDGEAFETILRTVGFKNTACKPLTFGISSIYTARK
ncbi:MAG TPA: bifunctional demethylmenaquinone methyltransferase/2-methoxy-6-polyprenyl-1,4-benzoquinol methylase UbiE [Chryseosolibacter sp.]|nr:bifunctional demethylmenaquinone methyltransferase/2-methoxy-6-polyprenyl-1,4-benzoquinol methylase UbiE [Chryseosolibacter sp.]